MFEFTLHSGETEVARSKPTEIEPIEKPKWEFRLSSWPFLYKKHSILSTGKTKSDLVFGPLLQGITFDGIGILFPGFNKPVIIPLNSLGGFNGAERITLLSGETITIAAGWKIEIS